MTRCYSDAHFTHDGIPGTRWDDFAVVRWFNQLAYGVVPGLLIFWGIMHLATQPEGGSGSCSASVLPMLGLTTATDHSTFHRYHFDHEKPADVAPKFRLPDPERRDTKPKHVLTVTKRVSALPVKFEAPRQSWQHLSTTARSAIDSGLKVMANAWQRVILHGSGTRAGNANLLDRYHRDVHRRSDGLAYHFVIGNGSQSADGQVEASERWLAGRGAADAEGIGLSESISVCLVGDFNAQAPSLAQLEALDELLDYLAVKLGSLPVTTHQHITGSDASCLGSQFPTEAVLKALGEPEVHL